MYREIEPDEFVQDLSSNMLWCYDKKKLLKEACPEAVIEDLDVSEIRNFLSEFVLEKCKIVLIDSKQPFHTTEAPEKYFGTRYRI